MQWPEWITNWTARIPLENEYLGFTIERWLTALAVLVLALLIIRIANAFISLRARRYAERKQTNWARGLVELIDATKLWFRLAIALYIGWLYLDLAGDPDAAATEVENVVIACVRVIVLLQMAVWGNVLLTFAISHYVKKKMEADAAAVTTVSALGFVGKLVLWSIVGLLALESMGIPVTTLVAGLGVGGIAVALAAQNILGDLFASLSIVLDKPFVLGDFIIVDDKMGNVEKIGLKTTRVRSLSGEQLIFSNTDLLSSRIRNYKRMLERRILFGIGVTYDTPKEKLERIPIIIREAVEAQEEVRFDRAHFKEFGDFSLNFEVVYYVLKPEYNVYMDIQQAINFILFERFAAEQIEFAFPTQTLYVNKTAAA